VSNRWSGGGTALETNCALTFSITLKGSATQNAGWTIGYLSPVQFENLQCA
jgi:hypothetical protein